MTPRTAIRRVTRPRLRIIVKETRGYPTGYLRAPSDTIECGRASRQSLRTDYERTTRRFWGGVWISCLDHSRESPSSTVIHRHHHPALRLLQRASRQGNADASLRVGDFFYDGRGGLARPDPARAATFYQARTTRVEPTNEDGVVSREEEEEPLPSQREEEPPQTSQSTKYDMIYIICRSSGDLLPGGVRPAARAGHLQPRVDVRRRRAAFHWCCFFGSEFGGVCSGRVVD